MERPEEGTSMSGAATRDRIFGLEPPLVFAHRGGAGEVPESTEEAIRWAVRHRADVLEFDLQLTRDGEIVVWHGPGLEIVHDGRDRFGEEVRIWDRRWQELDGSVWVVPPGEPDDRSRSTQRQLLSLESLLRLLRRIEEERGDGGRIPLNLELKPTKPPAPGWSGLDEQGRSVWERLFALLDPEVPRRTIVLASNEVELLEALRAKATRPDGFVYPTTLSEDEQLAYLGHMRTSAATLLARLRSFFTRGRTKPESLERLAFQTSWKLVSKELCEVVHTQGSGVYAFLTGFSRRGFRVSGGRSKPRGWREAAGRGLLREGGE